MLDYLLLPYLTSCLPTPLLPSSPHSLQGKPSSGGISDGLTSLGAWLRRGQRKLSASFRLSWPCIGATWSSSLQLLLPFTHCSPSLSYGGSRCPSSFDFSHSGATVVVFPSLHDLPLMKCPCWWWLTAPAMLGRFPLAPCVICYQRKLQIFPGDKA